MEKLWVFGDSFSASFNPKTDWGRTYVSWKGYVPKTYSNLISEEIGIDFENKAKGGLDNYSIMESIMDTADEIGENDIIIIGWSNTIRFRVSNPRTLSWETIIPTSKFNNLEQCEISKTTVNEIMINRTHNLYEIELTKFTKFINFAFKTQKIIHWRWDDFGRLKFYNTIEQETNLKVNDNHYSEIGHVEISKDLIECIKNKKRVNNLANFEINLIDKNKNKLI